MHYRQVARESLLGLALLQKGDWFKNEPQKSPLETGLSPSDLSKEVKQRRLRATGTPSFHQILQHVL